MATEFNLKTPLRQQRVLGVLDWLEWQMPTNQVRAKSSVEINQVYGTSRALRKYLKTLTLECVDQNYNRITGVCKKYRKRQSGVAQLLRAAGLAADYTPPVPELLDQELTWGRFAYSQKSNRQFHPLQFKNTVERKQILNRYGYQHHYDIDSAAMSLLMQNCYRTSACAVLRGIEDYTTSVVKTSIRSEIARQAHCTPEQVKLVINAVLQGSKLSTYADCRLFQKLNYDRALVRRLQHSDTLTGIRKDISRMWRNLKPSFNLPRGVRLSGRHKSQRYRQLEQLVTNSIRKYIQRHYPGTRTFWIHDGWCMDVHLDTPALERFVLDQTGYDVKVS